MTGCRGFREFRFLGRPNASTPSVQVQIREGSPEGNEWRKGFVKEMSFKSGVKGRGSDRCESECGYWIWIWIISANLLADISAMEYCHD